MSAKSRTIPFGLLFEESALPPVEQMEAYYNEDMDLSYVEGQDGIPIPFVENNARCLETQTHTKVKGEGTDSDPGNQPFAITMGTETYTLVRDEATDSDEDRLDALNLISRKRIVFGTETFTEIREEQTDSDE